MTGKLSDRAMVLLRHGDVDGLYEGDGSRVVGSIVLDALNNGCQRDYVRRLLMDPAHKGGFACLRRRRGNLDAWFDREWSRAAVKVASSPMVGDRHEATARATKLAGQAEELEWKGIGGATDLAVYRYVLAVAQRSGRLGPLGLAVREVAEGARVGRETAGKSLGRLQARGLLQRVASGSGTTTAVYAVTGGRTSDTRGSKGGRTPDTSTLGGRTSAIGRTSDIGRRSDTLSHTDPYVGYECPTYVPSDAWRWRGLGLTKARAWAHLSDETLTTSALAEILNVTPRTARRHLVVLAEHGLAERFDDAWIRGPASPDDVAEEVGTDGTLDHQRQRHQLERQLHDQALAELVQQANAAPFTVDPETGEVICLDALSEPPVTSQLATAEVQALLAAWPAGPCGRCGQRTGLEDFQGGWLCSCCVPFFTVAVDDIVTAHREEIAA